MGNEVYLMDLATFLSKLDTLVNSSSFKPHKYLVLLSVIDILNSKENPENKFYYMDIKKNFEKHFYLYAQNHDRNRPYIPYFHLRTSGFWFLKAYPGKGVILDNISKASAPKDIIENIEYAYFSESVFQLFINKEVIRVIQDYIISILNKQKDSTDTIREAIGNIYTGVSLFKHEEQTINKLVSNTKQFGVLISNILIFDSQSNNYLEFDVVLVTKWGIFVVELKHWSGFIRIAPYNWIVNDVSFRNDPHKINSYKSKVLKGIYQHEFRTYPNLWVQSVVVLTNPEATVEGSMSPNAAVEKNINNPTFASIQDFVAYLKKCNENKQKILNDQQVITISNYLKGLNHPKRAIKYTVPGYETLEYLSQKQDCIELIARPIESKVNGLNRFRIFRPPLNASNQEKERFNKRAYNTASTVSQIGDHPNILKVWVMKNEEGDIVEISEWSETGTLRDLLSSSNTPFEVERSLELCQRIADALKTAHNVGVIHRSLRPENVLMFNNIPKLINFDLAYQIEDNRVTVIVDASKLKDDGYIAPEILTAQDIDEGTDYFNLGVIAFELFTGQKPFASTRSFMTHGGYLSEDALSKLSKSHAPENVISVIKKLLVADRSQRLNDSEKIIAAFGLYGQKDQHLTISLENYELQPYDRYDLYEIIEKIGEGAEAQIYKAKTWKLGELEGNTIVLKLFNKEVSRDKIFREYQITNAIKSPYVVQCENLGYWKNDRYFLVLEYLDGQSLRHLIENNNKPDFEMFLQVTHGLMDAIKALHGNRVDEETLKPYLHSDIKPDNIIIQPDGKPVLIDFGIAGEPRIDSFQGTSDYIPPDSIIGVDMKFSQDGDLYSLGVTLWEWLFGAKPYKNTIIGEKPVLPQEMPIDLPEHIKNWFLKAVATEAIARFINIQEMEEAFVLKCKPDFDLPNLEEESIELIEKTEPKFDMPCEEDYLFKDECVNSFVYYLNTLSNISAGNENATAESQILNEKFKTISVPSSLTDYIFDLLVNGRRNVILTGNAGDGKTTIATQVRGKIRDVLKPLPPIEFLEEENIFIIKDMSELNIQKRLEILNQSINDNVNSYLIISNTGTLLDSFTELGKNGTNVDQNTILKALSSNMPVEILNGNFTIINIGSINSINTACEVFNRMIAPENWNDCLTCTLKSDCPTLFNVAMLQVKKDIVVDRIALIYRKLYEYNTRLTMRQMIGHLSYAITAGVSCKEIAAMSKIELKKNNSQYLFFNLFFGDNGKDIFSAAMQLLPIRKVQESSFGSFLDPLYERETWMRHDIKILEKESFTEEIIDKLSYLFNQTDPSSRRQVRRMLYFFGTMENAKGKQYISVFLRSPMLQKYMEFCNKKLSSLEERKYRMRILQVFQEFITGIRLPEGKWHTHADYLYVTLNKVGLSSRTQIVLADFRISDFELHVITKYKVAEEKNKTLSLCYKNRNICLDLDLPFLDFVARRYEGEIAEDLSPYYSDRLNKFKVRLLKLNNQPVADNEDLNLLTIGNNRTFKVIKISFADSRLEVLL